MIRPLKVEVHESSVLGNGGGGGGTLPQGRGFKRQHVYTEITLHHEAVGEIEILSLRLGRDESTVLTRQLKELVAVGLLHDGVRNTLPRGDDAGKIALHGVEIAVADHIEAPKCARGIIDHVIVDLGSSGGGEERLVREGNFAVLAVCYIEEQNSVSGINRDFMTASVVIILDLIRQGHHDLTIVIKNNKALRQRQLGASGVVTQGVEEGFVDPHSLPRSQIQEVVAVDDTRERRDEREQTFVGVSTVLHHIHHGVLVLIDMLLDVYFVRLKGKILNAQLGEGGLFQL